MGEVTRRQLSRGAAWAVPVLAVGAAAPAMAASACPTISLTSVGSAGGGTQWLVQLEFSNFQTGPATYSGTVTATEVNSSSGNTTPRQNTFAFAYDGVATTVPVSVLLQRQGPSYLSDVTVTLTDPVSCSQTFVLSAP